MWLCLRHCWKSSISYPKPPSQAKLNVYACLHDPTLLQFWNHDYACVNCLYFLNNYSCRFGFILEIDNAGVIEPDNDPPQFMGDESVEVRICTDLFPLLLMFYKHLL